jgi:general secretion pathway protein H
MVVLTIIGLIVALLPPLFAKALPGYRLRSTARELVADLRNARGNAVASGQEVALLLADRHYTLVGAATPRELPSSVTVDTVWVPPDERKKQGALIRFFPDGSATGARIGLTDHDRHAEIAVNWLTGKVTLDDE